MKHSRAFILVETLTGIALQAGFLLILCTSFYLVLSFYTRIQQTLTARERGQRVVAYFDARMRNAGLGFWGCGTSYDVRKALWPLTNPASPPDRPLKNPNLALPVAITYTDDDNTPNLINAEYKTKINTNGNKIYYGNILTLLYSERNIASGTNLYMISMTSNDITEYPNYKLKFLNKDIKLSDTEIAKKSILKENPYAVAQSIGTPFRVVNNKKEQISLLSIDIPAENVADELHYLRCKMLFVEGEGLSRNFKYQDLNSNWSSKYPHEKGILEIYMELDTETKTFDLYVLSTGGIDNSAKRKKPANWPDNARWKNEYLQHALYISRASWKLYNLENFKF